MLPLTIPIGTVDKLISILKRDPFINPPADEKLKGELLESYSRRINIQHRLVYSVDKQRKEINVIRMRNHYE